MHDPSIVALYRNKGDQHDCTNYHGISLLSTLREAFAHVLLNRLQLLADKVCPKSQWGFRAQRLIVNMVFSLCLLQETSWEHRRPLYIAFIELLKALLVTCGRQLAVHHTSTYVMYQQGKWSPTRFFKDFLLPTEQLLPKSSVKGKTPLPHSSK